MEGQVIRGPIGPAVLMSILVAAAFGIFLWVGVTALVHPLPDVGSVIVLIFMEVFILGCGVFNLFLLTTQVELFSDRIVRSSVFGRREISFSDVTSDIIRYQKGTPFLSVRSISALVLLSGWTFSKAQLDTIHDFVAERCKSLGNPISTSLPPMSAKAFHQLIALMLLTQFGGLGLLIWLLVHRAGT